MSEQKENGPNKETQMATSQDETDHENPPETPQQESKPEEEEDKKTVRNPRNVVLEPDPLEPFLVRLEHDPATQEGFFNGMIEFHRQNREYPFEREEAMEDYINNWLMVRVPRLHFQQTLDRLWRRYLETGSAIGENLNALSPEHRRVFLLQNRILFAYYSEQKDKKRKNQEKYGGTSRNKVVTIGGSNAPPDKEPEKGLKQYKEVDKKWKKVLETKWKQNLKQEMPEYQEQEVEKPEQKRENPPDEKLSEEDEEEEAWSEAHYETLIEILQSLADYNIKLSRFPYDDVNDMEDFIKNWVKLDISVSACLEVIKRLKKNFKKLFSMVIDKGFQFRNQKQEQLYNCADVVWNAEALMNSDDEGEEEEEEEKEKEAEKDSSDDQKRLESSDTEYDPAMPYVINSTPNLMSIDDSVFQDMLLPPVPPVWRFQDTKKEDNKQQKAGSDKDSSSENRTVPQIIVRRKIPRVQFQDTEKVDKYQQKKKRYRLIVCRGTSEVQGFQDTEKVDKNQQTVKTTGPQTILRGIPPGPQFQNSKIEEMLQRPIPPVPRFHYTKKEGKNQQKADCGEDSSSENRTDPGRVTNQGDRPYSDEPHDENPAGGSEAREEPMSGGEETKDAKKQGNRTDPGGVSTQGDDPDSEESHDENPKGGSAAPEEPENGGEETKDTKKQENRTDPGGVSSQGDDPDFKEPHDENPEGGSEAPEEPKSGGEEANDTRKP